MHSASEYSASRLLLSGSWGEMASMDLLVNGNRLDIVVLLWLKNWHTELSILWAIDGEVLFCWDSGKLVEVSGPIPVLR